MSFSRSEQWLLVSGIFMGLVQPPMKGGLLKLDGLGWRVGVLSERLLSYIYTIPGQAFSIKRVYFMLWDGIVHF